MKRVVSLVVVAALAQSGCLSYIMDKHTTREKVKPAYAALAVVAEVGLGMLFGLGLQSAAKDTPEGDQLGTPAWLAIGSAVGVVVDGVGAAVISFADDDD